MMDRERSGVEGSWMVEDAVRRRQLEVTDRMLALSCSSKGRKGKEGTRDTTLVSASALRCGGLEEAEEKEEKW
jgi:hypothetical protein